jgi:energy-coupling factor transporter transmembrane protein EcfT
VDNITFGKYINNHSFLTKIDARVKILMMIVLLVFCFVDLNIVSFGCLFGVLVLFMLVGKLRFKPLLKIVKHMWLLFIMLLVIDILIGFLFANAQEIDKFKIFRIVFVIICAVWFTVAVTAVALFAIAQSDSYMLVYMGLCVGNVALVISSIAITAKMCRANDISIW